MHSRSQAFTAATIALSILAIATIVGGCTQTVPAVTGSSPKQNAESVSMDQAVISITFDQPMTKGSVERSVSITPDIGSTPPRFVWSDDNRTLKLIFSQPYLKEAVYTARIAADARSREGVALSKPYVLRFTTRSAKSTASKTGATSADDAG